MTKTAAKADEVAVDFLAELKGSRLTFRLRGDVIVNGVVEDYHRGFIRLGDVTVSGIIGVE